MQNLLAQPVALEDAKPGDLIGFGKTGKPWYLIAGAAEGDGDGGDGDGGGDGGSGGSLLDGEGDVDGNGDGGGDGNGDGGDGGDGGGDGQQQQVDVGAIVDQLEQRLGDRFDSIADRRVNALLKEMRKQGGQGGSEGGGGSGDGGDGAGGAAEQRGPDPQVVRAARLAYREYVGTEFKPISNVERDFAADLAALLIPVEVAKAGPDADDDAIGRAVAKTVGEKVKTLRKHYEEKTVAALKRRGVDVSAVSGGDGGSSDTGGSTTTRPGQRPPAPRGKGEGSSFAKGAERAAAMFGQPAAAASGQ